MKTKFDYLFLFLKNLILFFKIKDIVYMHVKWLFLKRIHDGKVSLLKGNKVEDI